MLNVLISCAGRHAGLIRTFAAALDDGLVIAADQNPDALALTAADRGEPAPAIDADDYLEWMLERCTRNDVGLLLSLYEPDTVRLEAIRAPLAERGCVLIGTPPEIIELAEDKVRTRDLAQRAGLDYPDTWLLSEITDAHALPDAAWVVKERRGRGSRGLRTHANTEDLVADAKGEADGDAWIAQPIVEGTHFSIDIVNDLDRAFQAVFVREKHEMRNGEAWSVTTVAPERFEALGATLGTVIGHQGCIDIDIVEHAGRITLLDVNPRFGGAYIFSHAAGANLPAALVAWRRGAPVDPAWLRPIPGRTLDRTQLEGVFPA